MDFFTGAGEWALVKQDVDLPIGVDVAGLVELLDRSGDEIVFDTDDGAVGAFESRNCGSGRLGPAGRQFLVGALIRARRCSRHCSLGENVAVARCNARPELITGSTECDASSCFVTTTSPKTLCHNTTTVSTMGVTVETNRGEDELRSLFRQSADPILTAIEVADKLNISQQAAHAKLSDANQEGWISRKKVGSRAVVWWLADQAPESA